MTEQQAYENTDVRLFSDKEGNEVFATQDLQGLGINVGGLVIVKPVAAWHALAKAALPPALLYPDDTPAGVKGLEAPSLTWCEHCGEGVTDFCRSKTTRLCPKGLLVPHRNAGVPVVQEAQPGDLNAALRQGEQDRADLAARAGWFLPYEAVKHLTSLPKLLEHAKRANLTNATVRKDGKETTYEADWIKHMRWVGPSPDPGVSGGQHQTKSDHTPMPADDAKGCA